MLTSTELSLLGQVSNTSTGHILVEGESVEGESFELLYFSSPELSMITVVTPTKRLFMNSSGVIEISSKNTRIHYSGKKFASTAFCSHLSSSSKPSEQLSQRLGFVPTTVFEIVCNFVGLPVRIPSHPCKSV